MNENLIKILSKQKIYPIIRSNNPETVLEKAHALLAGGILAMEINLENPSIYNAIREISNEAVVCAGGVITSIQAQAAIDCGAKGISSPIFHMNLVKFSKDKRVPLIAGTSTANEAYNAWKARIPVTKIYPVTALGGVSYVKNLLRPMSFLNVIPQGDVKLNQIKDYLDAGAFAVGVGRDLLEGSASLITEKAKKIVEQIEVL